MDKLERLLNLTAALLNTSRPLSAAELRRRLGTGAYSDSKAAFRRTFERDKADLRAIGVPVEVSMLNDVDPPVEGYRISAARYTGRDLRFEPDELAVLHLAAGLVRVEGAAASALDKLGGSEDTPEAGSLGELGGAGGPGGAPGDGTLSGFGGAGGAPGVGAAALGELPFHEVLSALVAAAAGARRVSFEYRGATRRGVEHPDADAREAESRDVAHSDAAEARDMSHPDAERRDVESRDVEPWRLAFNRGHWYLVGFDRDRQRERLFRVDRIDGPVADSGPAEHPVGRGPDPGAVKPWEFGAGEATEARVLVDADQAAWACHSAGTDGERRPDGSVVLTLAVRDTAALRTFVLGFLEHAEVLEPQWLREEMADWLEALAHAPSV